MFWDVEVMGLATRMTAASHSREATCDLCNRGNYSNHTDFGIVGKHLGSADIYY
jgi:hypothetical protein